MRQNAGMPRRRPASHRLAAQALGLGVAAPQVVAHRVARMARAGTSPSPADRREFVTMGAEKVAAFVESWAAMGALALQTQMRLWSSWMALAWPTSPAAMPRAAAASAEAIARLLSAGVAPVQRRAAANARRLSRGRR